jgi:hypothetical protein
VVDDPDATLETLLAARRLTDTDATRTGLRQLATLAGLDFAARLARPYHGRGESVDDLDQSPWSD